MGRLEDKHAVPALIGVLERPKEAEDVKKAAARALGVILGQPLTLEAKVWRSRAADAGVPGMTGN